LKKIIFEIFPENNFLFNLRLNEMTSCYEGADPTKNFDLSTINKTSLLNSGKRVEMFKPKVITMTKKICAYHIFV
jgi:hypothetical protein